jgi:catechol 2,3-dioxygenase-like lactoylglutathione lyase family enzyme
VKLVPSLRVDVLSFIGLEWWFIHYRFKNSISLEDQLKYALALSELSWRPIRKPPIKWINEQQSWLFFEDTMADLWLGDFGLRVTDFEKSIAFYTKLLDLEVLVRKEAEDSKYILFRDRRSGQRMELNWYSEASPFWTPYTAGEGLDHIEVRVRDIPKMIEQLETLGIPIATKKLWTNKTEIEKIRKDPKQANELEEDMWVISGGHRIVYIQDPDGIFLCLYDHPEEKWDGPIPDHY